MLKGEKRLKNKIFFLKKKLNFVTKGLAVTTHPVDLITLVGNITCEKITHLILSWFHSYRIICKCHIVALCNNNNNIV